MRLLSWFAFTAHVTIQSWAIRSLNFHRVAFFSSIGGCRFECLSSLSALQGPDSVARCMLALTCIPWSARLDSVRPRSRFSGEALVSSVQCFNACLTVQGLGMVASCAFSLTWIPCSARFDSVHRSARLLCGALASSQCTCN